MSDTTQQTEAPDTKPAEFEGRLWLLEGNPLDTAMIYPIDRIGRRVGMGIWVMGGAILRAGQQVGTVADLVLHRKGGDDGDRSAGAAGAGA